MLSKAEKSEKIAQLKEEISNAQGVFLTNLIGISSNDAVALRKNIREVNGKVVVTRNTLFRKAAEGTAAENLLSNLKGPHALAFAFDDAAAVAKCLKNASKEHEQVSLLAGVLDGNELSVEEVTQLADLPSRDEMLGTLLATFNAPISALARVLNSIKEQKEEGTTEAATEAAE